MQTLDGPQTKTPGKSLPAAKPDAVSPQEVVTTLEKHILVDGFKLVFDPQRSRGSRFVDAATGCTLIDLYGFYASQPVGFNHPYFDRPDVQADLLAAAKVKVANADVYTTQYATFVKTFARVVGCRRWNGTLSKAERLPSRTRSRRRWIGKSQEYRGGGNAARRHPLRARVSRAHSYTMT
jgi:hypothetical protein